MKRGVAGLVALSFAVGAFACGLIAGIEDRPFHLADAGDERPIVPPPAADAGAGADADLCAHGSVPPPAGDDDSETTHQRFFTLAMRTADAFGLDDAGVPLGFDLDGTCTCFAGPTARRGLPSCASPSRNCDDDAGGDNGATAIIALASGAFGTNDPLALNHWAECGEATLILALQAYNGRENDSNVKVGPIPSYGLLLPDGGFPDFDAGMPEGGILDAGMSEAGIADAGRPSRCTDPWPLWGDGGVDIWSGDPKYYTYVEGAPYRPDRTVDAYVAGGMLVAQQRLAFPLQAGRVLLELSSVLMVARLTPVDAHGQPYPGGFDGTAPAFRMDAVVAGRMSMSDLLVAIGEAYLGQDVPLCEQTGPLNFEVVKKNICPHADIASDPSIDFLNDSGVPCDAISFAWRLTLFPARLGKSQNMDPPPRACPDLDASCF